MNGIRPELGARGIVALLTPGGNPTVEPELSVLLGGDVAVLASRMHDDAPDMPGRLLAYASPMSRWLAPFAATPLDAVGFACTGSAYLTPAGGCGAPGSLSLGGRSVPLRTAAGAIEAALRDMDVRRIALVSPYDAALTDRAVAYWTARGLIVEAVVPVAAQPGFHPIYAQRQANVVAAVREARRGGADAVLISGTGAPSLGAHVAIAHESGPPLLSSNLCLGWQLRAALPGAEGIALSRWIGADPPWAADLLQRFPASIPCKPN